MLIKLINRHIKPYWGLIGAVLALQLVATIASLYLPNLNARIIDQGVARGDTHYIWVHGAWMLGVSLVQVAAQIAAVWFGARAAMQFGRDVRDAIFHRVLGFSSRELNHFGAPSLLTRTTNDVQQVQQLVLMTCVMMISAPITMVGGIIMAVREDPGMSWLILAAVAALAAGVVLLIWRVTPLFGIQQTRIDNLNRVLREQITGIRVVRAFVREPHEAKRFEQTNADLTQTATSLGRHMSFMFPFVMLIMNLGSVGVMWFGGHRIAEGHIQVGQLTAFLTYLMQILMSVMMATMMLVFAPRAAVCAGRIMEVLDTSSSVIPPQEGVTELAGRGVLEMRDVEFTYPGAEVPVLDEINLQLAPGRTTAIIGSTGSGKSTLVNLIPRLFDVTGGQVLVDGIDVREIDPDTLWARVGLVPQKPWLFSGTVASNLRYGKPDATDDELWAALETAQAADFVREMDGQLEAEIAQGGTNVSGGQRQRLSIARALVKKPGIYVFDDSFSALDVATDARLRAALAKETNGSAVLIVAQRVSTIREADEILVLEDGRIVGRGTHDQLLASCPTYVEIVDSQLSAEEAA
ncbi:ABC transporter ATP-binding protein [Luteococcus japonicus]|uniref:Lipid A export ATP-binding/permease protein MsbA n=1 Tax=Luteococcus japonicus LSP_Lj1 TaxID=1255658 RepID=A0A1R4JZB2_9ACTN|nr:ABC transporter ATP-binding protein [Luteococcus japonicus]SJN37135.1 Lipid A export ATP-binding/permease protein MsbA [Luteococcus japonicus LSP_Lj1]